MAWRPNSTGVAWIDEHNVGWLVAQCWCLGDSDKFWDQSQLHWRCCPWVCFILAREGGYPWRLEYQIYRAHPSTVGKVLCIFWLWWYSKTDSERLGAKYRLLWDFGISRDRLELCTWAHSGICDVLEGQSTSEVVLEYGIPSICKTKLGQTVKTTWIVKNILCRKSIRCWIKPAKN